MVSLNDVLLAMSNIPVDDPIAEIWGRGLQGGYEIIEYTGTLPITITADGSALLDYQIYGNTEQTGTPTPENPVDVVGCGVRTENLWNADKVGRIQVASDASIERYGIALSGSAFSLRLISNSEMYYKIKTDDTYETAVQLLVGVAVAITITDNQTLLVYGGNQALVKQVVIQINSGSTAHPYEPYGYKLPMVVESGEQSQYIPIYIGDSKLGEEEYVDYEEQKVYKRTENLWNFTTQPLSGYGYLYNGSIILPAGTYTLRVDAINIKGGMSFAVVDSQGNTVINAPISNHNSRTFTSVYDMIHLRFYVSNTVGELYLTLVEGSAPPDAYIPYLQPTDPPVPLPEIPTFEGTTVIDYDGAPKPEKMYVKYRR